MLQFQSLETADYDLSTREILYIEFFKILEVVFLAYFLCSLYEIYKSLEEKKEQHNEKILMVKSYCKKHAISSELEKRAIYDLQNNLNAQVQDAQASARSLNFLSKFMKEEIIST